ncbi:MAG TPA: hypothetical protein VIH48_05080 [Candidatus Bathyarchaeia archaeon]
MKAKILIPILIIVVVVVALIFLYPNYLSPNPTGQNWKTGPGTARNPPSGLTANQTVFAQYFSNMGLVTDGWSGFENATESFSSNDDVIVLVNATNTVTLLAYVDDMGNHGLFTGVEKELAMPVGLGTLNLGKLQPGSYVVRVIVNDVCVKNLLFTVA